MSSETFIGEANTPIKCPDCGKMTGIFASAQAFEGDWVNKCWSCDFMWSHEDDDLKRAALLERSEHA